MEALSHTRQTQEGPQEMRPLRQQVARTEQQFRDVQTVVHALRGERVFERQIQAPLR